MILVRKKNVLVLCFVFISNSYLNAQVIESSHFITNLECWDDFDSNNALDVASAYLKKADEYYEYIYNYLKNSKNVNMKSNKCAIYIVDSGIEVNRCSGNAIYIDNAFVDKGCIPLAHEITHLILNCRSIDSISEGLADYFLSYFVQLEDLKEQYYYGNVHEKIKVIWEFKYDYDRINKIADGYITDYYSVIESQSFVQFLIEEYGMDKFINYFDGGGYVDYKEIFGYSKDEILMKWINTINNMTHNKIWVENWKEINEYYFNF